MIISRPRRLTPPAAPGTLLKRFGARPESEPRSVKRDGYEDPEYLTLVRQLPCLRCGMEPCGEAAHVRFASAAFGKASGLQRKPEDKWALPLCGEDHRISQRAQHKQNEEAFWQMLGINPLLTAQRLYAQRGDHGAMRMVIAVAIAERSLVRTIRGEPPVSAIGSPSQMCVEGKLPDSGRMKRGPHERR
jgi:hypothetical protein